MHIERPWIGQLALACAALGCSALGWSALGCADRAEIPDLPSLAQLSEEYDAPTAELSQTDVRPALDSVPDLERLLAAFRSAATVLERVEDAQEPAQERTGKGIQLRGALYVTLRCPGQLEQPRYEEAQNGSVALTAAVSANRIRRTIGGEAKKCRFNAQLGTLPLPVVLDGRVDLDMGADKALGQSWSDQGWLVAVQGSITVNDISFGGISARISGEKVESLLRLPDGTSVVLSAAPTSISVRTRDAVWSCNTASDLCKRN
jgi:hypothetical protein